MQNLDLSSILVFMDTLHTEEDCHNFLENQRWGNGFVCPVCQQSGKYTTHEGNGKRKRYRCCNCKAIFSLYKGTIFEDTNLPLRKWFMAIHDFLLTKKGVSSYKMAGYLGISQPNAWYLLHRIRYGMRRRKMPKFIGPVEIDETFVGGKNSNRHYNKRKKGTQGRSLVDKKALVAVYDRYSGQVYLWALSALPKKGLQGIVKSKIEKGSTIYTDEYKGYTGLNKEYKHITCNHGAYQYVNGEAHTNNLEGFWSHVKRGIKGTYHQVSKRLLINYGKEFEFRNNVRKMGFNESLSVLLKAACSATLKRADL